MLRKRDISLSIHTPDGTKQCELYDSMCQFEGQAANLQIVYDEDDLWTMTFDVPRRITDNTGNLVENYRWGFCRNEYLVYYTEDGVTDVYTIKNVEEEDKGGVESGKVSCIHRSEQLKAKGFALSLESYVGETSELANIVLNGTGWTLGHADDFYEEDLYNKRISSLQGLIATPAGISFGAYLEIDTATGDSVWSASNGWQNAHLHIETHGKNLCDGLIERGHLNADDGTPEYSTQTNAYRTINYVEIGAFAGEKLTLSGTDVGGAEWHFFNGAKIQLSMTTGLTATLPAGTKYIKYELWRDSTGSTNYSTAPTNVQLEWGASATAYEDYVVPYTIDVPNVGKYDIVQRNHIYRYTIYTPGDSTPHQSSTLLGTEDIDAYTARLYEGGSIFATNTGAGTASIAVYYTVSSAEGALPREKVRTLSKESGTSAYEALRDIAEIMGAKLWFDGLNKEVYIVKRIGRDTGVVFDTSYNMKSIARTRASNELVTRMYIGDMDGVTISSVNPMGTNYLLDFSYARQAGILTQAQEAAITAFQTGIASINANLLDYLDLQFETTNKINSLIGATPFGTATVSSYNSSTSTLTLTNLLYYEGGGIPSTESTLYVRGADGIWYQASIVTYNSGSKTMVVSGLTSTPSLICWYDGALPGTIGARIIAIKSKRETYDLAKQRYDAATDTTEKQTYSEAMSEALAALADLSEGTATMVGLSQMYAELNALITALNLVNDQIDAANSAADSLNDQFEEAMGDLLRDGIYDEGEYIEGQESALYTDVKEALAKAALPQVEYSVDALDRGFLEEYGHEQIAYGDGVYITNHQMGIEHMPATVIRYIDEPMSCRCNSFNIGNFDRNGDDLFQSIIDATNAVKSNQKVLEKAVVLTADGLIDPELIRQSIQAIETPEATTDEKEIDITQIENFDSAVSQVVQDNLLTGALNAANIDWSKIDDLVLTVNSFIVTATSGLEDEISGLQSQISLIPGQISLAVDSINVGVRNMLLDTATVQTGNVTGGTNQSRCPYLFSQYWFDTTKNGKEFVLSFDWSTTATSGTFYCQLNGQPWTRFGSIITVSSTNQSGHFSYKGTLSSAQDVTTYTGVNFRCDNMTGTITISNLIMEFGNKATGWTPAPEDAEAEYSSLHTEISLVPGQISLAVNSITVGGSNIIRGTNSITTIGADAAHGQWSNAAWRTASSGTGTRTPVDITDPPSGNISKGVAFTMTSNLTTLANGVAIGQNGVPVTAGETYTFSCYVKGSGRICMAAGVSQFEGGHYVLANTGTWERMVHTIVMPSDANHISNGKTNVFFGATAQDSNFTVCGMQMQVGNKATDWSPSPEDTEAEYNEVRTGLSLVPGQITSAVEAVKVGGTNLLKASDTPKSGTAYNLARYDLTESIPAGEQVTLRLWGTLGANKTGFAAYNSGGYVGLADPLTDNGDGTFSKTFTWKTVQGSSTASNTQLYIYVKPNSVTDVTSTITKIKLERGNKATGWSPAPADADAEYASIRSEIQQTANEISLAVDGVKVGGTNLLPQSKQLPTGSTGYDWVAQSGYSWTYYATGATDIDKEFNRIMIKYLSGDLTWRAFTSPYVTLGNDWYGREVTFSAYVYSPDWSAVDKGCSLSLALEDTVSTTRKRWGDAQIVTSTGVWASGVTAGETLASGKWQRFSVTFTLDTDHITGESSSPGTFTNMKYMKIIFWLVKHGEIRFYAPKLEWGNKATTWCDSNGELVNSSIKINDTGVYISSTGTFQLDAQNPDQNAYLNIRGLLQLDNSGGLQAEQGRFNDSLQVGGLSVVTTPENQLTVRIAGAQPSGHNIIWLQPSSTSRTSYSCYSSSVRDNTVRFGYQNPISFTFAPGSSATLANANFTYTLEFDVVSLSDTTLTGLSFKASATHGSVTVTESEFSTQSAASMTKWQTLHVTLTASTTKNLCTTANDSITVNIRAAASSADMLTSLYVQSQQYMTLTVASDASTGAQACTVKYIP